MAGDRVRGLLGPALAGALALGVLGAGPAPAYTVDAIDGPLTSGDALFPNQFAVAMSVRPSSSNCPMATENGVSPAV